MKNIKSGKSLVSSHTTKREHMLIATTVADTLTTILKNQPAYLAKHFAVSLATSPGSEFKYLSENEGVEVFSVPMVRGIDICRDLVSLLKMTLLLLKIRPTIVHSYTPKAGLVCMLAAWLCRVPIRVHTFTGLIFPTSQGWKKKLLIWIDRIICACATHIVPEGEGVKRDLEKNRITRKPLKVIGYGNIAGVDTHYFSAEDPEVEKESIILHEKLAIPETDFVFCYIGRLNRDKGLNELMDAFQTMPDSVHLVLAGGFDSSAPVDNCTLIAIASNPRVHRLGFVRDIRPVLKMADILVLPSYREGFPNVVLEAGAMELPVIATDINGCNEVIKKGANGWLIPTRDSKALRGAMDEAFSMPEIHRRKMGSIARSRVQERFERQKHWTQMVVFYNSLLDGKNLKKN